MQRRVGSCQQAATLVNPRIFDALLLVVLVLVNPRILIPIAGETGGVRRSEQSWRIRVEGRGLRVEG
jgi:hypothetical protein